jgi:16S rRNA (guanine966-N2)-methyltransferase
VRVSTRKPDKAQRGSLEPVRGKLNSVRIIGGSWRGRRVRFPDSPGLRPTPDRVRETLFNWLQHEIAGARCLDLFAGSGALGLEALSRGAAEVVFVEPAFAPAEMLAEELGRLFGGGANARGGAHARGGSNARGGATAGKGSIAGAGAHAREGSKFRIAQMSAERFLAAGGEPFDVVFLDPPFGLDALSEYASRLDAGGWLQGGGWIYLEGERAAGLPAIPARWELVKSKSAGEVGYHLARAISRAQP